MDPSVPSQSCMQWFQLDNMQEPDTHDSGSKLWSNAAHQGHSLSPTHNPHLPTNCPLTVDEEEQLERAEKCHDDYDQQDHKGANFHFNPRLTP